MWRDWGFCAFVALGFAVTGCQSKNTESTATPASDEIGWCGSLASGETRIASSMATGMKASYALSRPGADESYVVTLNVAFVGIDGADGDAMRTKAEGCLANARSMFTGPGGKSLQFRLAGADENAASLPPSVTVHVVPWLPRGDQGSWSSDFECPIIVHELVHLTGLPDLYEEPVESQQYDCRSTGRDDLLMSQPEQAFRAVARGTRSSLLSPAEFNAVLNPGCSASNARFYRCAKNAYRTSLELGGAGCLAASDCDNDGWLFPQR